MDASSSEPTPPVIRYAPVGEIRIFQIQESELDELAYGSPASLYLNFSLTLLPTSASLLISLLLTDIKSNRVYLAFFSAFLITLIAGLILMAFWLRAHRSSRFLIQRIKNRMPPPEGIQEVMPG